MLYLLISTLFSAEIVISCAILFGILNSNIQEKVWQNLPFKLSFLIRNVFVSILITYSLVVVVFQGGCELGWFKQFLSVTSMEFNFCALDFHVQTKIFGFLGMISLIVSLFSAYAIYLSTLNKASLRKK